jgi:hypothetical protein
MSERASNGWTFLIGLCLQFAHIDIRQPQGVATGKTGMPL